MTCAPTSPHVRSASIYVSAIAPTTKPATPAASWTASRGGAARLDFADSGTVIDSQVSAFEPGRVLEYSWSSPGQPLRPVRWEIAAAGEATALTLIQRTPLDEDPGRACAGWEAHLEMLQAALEGVPIKFPFESFKAARDAYRPKVAAL